MSSTIMPTMAPHRPDAKSRALLGVGIVLALLLAVAVWFVARAESPTPSVDKVTSATASTSTTAALDHVAPPARDAVAARTPRVAEQLQVQPAQHALDPSRRAELLEMLDRFDSNESASQQSDTPLNENWVPLAREVRARKVSAQELVDLIDSLPPDDLRAGPATLALAWARDLGPEIVARLAQQAIEKANLEDSLHRELGRASVAALALAGATEGLDEYVLHALDRADAPPSRNAQGGLDLYLGPLAVALWGVRDVSDPRWSGLLQRELAMPSSLIQQKLWSVALRADGETWGPRALDAALAKNGSARSALESATSPALVAPLLDIARRPPTDVYTHYVHGSAIQGLLSIGTPDAIVEVKSQLAAEAPAREWTVDALSKGMNFACVGDFVQVLVDAGDDQDLIHSLDKGLRATLLEAELRRELPPNAAAARDALRTALERAPADSDGFDFALRALELIGDTRDADALQRSRELRRRALESMPKPEPLDR